jgi:hypothetical protein
MNRGTISGLAALLFRSVAAVSLALPWTIAHSADYQAIPAAPSAPSWNVTVTPYAWLTSLNGSQTVRGRTVDVDETFFDIVHDTIGKGGQLFAAMAMQLSTDCPKSTGSAVAR